MRFAFDYGLSTVLAVTMHGLIIAGLLSQPFHKPIDIFLNQESLATALTAEPLADSPVEPEPIQSTVVKAEDLAKELQRLDHEAQAKVAKAKAEANALKAERVRIAKAKKAAEDKAAAVKAERLRAQKAQAAKEKALEAAKKAQAAKEKALAEQAKALEEKEKAHQAAVAKEKARQAKLAEAAKAKKAQEEKARQAAAEKAAQALAAQQAKAQIAKDKQEIAQYAGLIRSKIHQNWRKPIGIDSQNLSCTLQVKVNTAGDVLDVTVVNTSGNLELDRSSLAAVHRSSPLPLPDKANLAKEFQSFLFTFKPEAV